MSGACSQLLLLCGFWRLKASVLRPDAWHTAWHSVSARCGPITLISAKTKSTGSVKPSRPSETGPESGRAPAQPDPVAPARPEVRNAAGSSPAPDAACQGQPAAGPRPARPPSPGRPYFRPSGQSQSPGPGGDASRSVAPSRTEAGPPSPSALVQTGWLCSRARPRQAGPHPARGRFPWQQRGLRRPTVAKPRCVTSLGYPRSGRSLPVSLAPSVPGPHFFTLPFVKTIHSLPAAPPPCTVCLPKILLSLKLSRI